MSERQHIPTTAQIVESLTMRLFGRPIVQNNVRGEVVETMLSFALDATWSQCGADWAGWDFQSKDGLRLQVRQSAAKQTWSAVKRIRPTFSIKSVAGYWQGPRWHPSPGRQAEIFIFAWHPVTTAEAEHRDAHQWRFWVIAERDLPPKQKSLSLPTLQRGWGIGLSFHEVGTAVSTLASQLRDRSSSGSRLA